MGGFLAKNKAILNFVDIQYDERYVRDTLV